MQEVALGIDDHGITARQYLDVECHKPSNGNKKGSSKSHRQSVQKLFHLILLAIKKPHRMVGLGLKMGGGYGLIDFYKAFVLEYVLLDDRAIGLRLFNAHALGESVERGNVVFDKGAF